MLPQFGIHPSLPHSKTVMDCFSYPRSLTQVDFVGGILDHQIKLLRDAKGQAVFQFGLHSGRSGIYLGIERVAPLIIEILMEYHREK